VCKTGEVPKSRGGGMSDKQNFGQRLLRKKALAGSLSSRRKWQSQDQSRLLGQHGLKEDDISSKGEGRHKGGLSHGEFSAWGTMGEGRYLPDPPSEAKTKATWGGSTQRSLGRIQKTIWEKPEKGGVVEGNEAELNKRN